MSTPNPFEGERCKVCGNRLRGGRCKGCAATIGARKREAEGKDAFSKGLLRQPRSVKIETMPAVKVKPAPRERYTAMSVTVSRSLYLRVVAYAEAQGCTQAEAVRRLCEMALSMAEQKDEAKG